MARIDTSHIEGYNAMTTEQKLAAIEALELPEPDYTGYVAKNLFDTTASDLAKAKKTIKALENQNLSAEERIRNEQTEKYNELQDKYDKLERENRIYKHTASLVNLGYDEKLAKETATAMADGDFEKVFSNQQKYQADRDKKLTAQLLQTTPPPVGDGKSEEPMTKEKLRRMSPDERYAFAEKHPDEYAKIYGG